MNKYEQSIRMLKEWNDKEHIFTKPVIDDLQELVERATKLPSKEIIQSAITVLTILPVLEDEVCLKALNDIIKLSNILYGSE